MIELKTPAEIAAMREAGRVVATTLAAVLDAATTGTSLRELDDLARTVIGDGGAKPSFLGYHPPFAPTPFPGVICTSVLHGRWRGYPVRMRIGLSSGDVVLPWCHEPASQSDAGA